MKQFTTKQQTEKLIELGFPKPQSIAGVKMGTFMGTKIPCIEKEFAYSIGELIKILPMTIERNAILRIEATGVMWRVMYEGSRGLELLTFRSEPIDALFDMIAELKDKGLI